MGNTKIFQIIFHSYAYYLANTLNAFQTHHFSMCVGSHVQIFRSFLFHSSSSSTIQHCLTIAVGVENIMYVTIMFEPAQYNLIFIHYNFHRYFFATSMEIDDFIWISIKNFIIKWNQINWLIIYKMGIPNFRHKITFE